MATDERKNGPDTGSIDKQPAGNVSEHSNSTGTTNTGTRTGTGNSGTGTAGRTAGNKTEEKLLEMAAVKAEPKPEKKPEQKPVYIPEQKPVYIPEGLTPIVPTPPPATKQRKPRKVNKAKPKKETGPDVTQLNNLIKTVSGVVASRPGNAHWMLTDKEVESITTPLAAMLEEMAIVEKLGEHSNQVALAVACVSVFAPRIIVTVNQKKEVKKVERELKQKLTRPAEESAKKPSGGNVKRTSGNSTGNGNDVPFYGSALY